MPCSYRKERPDGYLDIGPGCQFDVPDHELIDNNRCIFHQGWGTDQDNAGHKRSWNDNRIGEFNEKIFSYIKACESEGNTIDLTGVVFPGKISFSDHISDGKIKKPILFTAAEFRGEVVFAELIFIGEVIFYETTFRSIAQFSGSKFLDSLSFEHSVFESLVSLTGVTLHAFYGDHSLFKAAFFLSDAVMLDQVILSESNFESSFSSRRSVFNDEISFRNSRLTGGAEFQETVFKFNVDFSADEVETSAGGLGAVNFDEATVESLVNFNNRIFQAETSFANTRFEYAPEFHNSKLHQDTNFTGTQFLDTTSEGSARAYRTLKLAMEGHRARTEEAMFYALEQESIRHQPDTPFAVKVFSLLYQWGSDYGRNFVAPFGWLIYFSLFFAFTYSQLGLGNPDALSFTVQQYVRPFLVWGEANVSVGVKLLASVQSLLGLGLGTLFVLAVRRRFRMG